MPERRWDCRRAAVPRYCCPPTEKTLAMIAQTTDYHCRSTSCRRSVPPSWRLSSLCAKRWHGCHQQYHCYQRQAQSYSSTAVTRITSWPIADRKRWFELTRPEIAWIQPFEALTPTAVRGVLLWNILCQTGLSCHFCNFWHPDTLTLSPERQSARMSKITNDGLTWSGTGCFTAASIWQQWASNG